MKRSVFQQLIGVRWFIFGDIYYKKGRQRIILIQRKEVYIFKISYNKMAHQFPSYQFRQALITSSKIKTSLQPFLLQFKKNNMHWIFSAIQELFQYLHNPKIQLNVAANALFAVKFMLDTADIVMTNIIEVYLLPKIIDIALCQISTGKQKRGHSYFISKGFTGDKNDLQYRGFNFIRMANELIMAGSQIKPKKICLKEEIQQPSDFHLALQKLKAKGFKPYENFEIYRISVSELRKVFVKKLQSYEKEIGPFKEYMLSFIRQYLIKGVQPKGDINPFRVLEKGEATANQLVGKECIESLKSDNLNERRRALIVLSDLMRWGDIFVAFQVNSSPVVEKIVRQIDDPKDNNKRLGRALQILKKYQNTNSQKQQYYRQLLKGLRFWSKCYPTAVKTIDKVSTIKYLYGKLESQQIEFPPYENIFAHEAVFQSNKRKKRHFNQKLSQYYQSMGLQKHLDAIVIPILQMNPVFDNLATSLFDKFQRQILMVRDILYNLYEDQKKLLEYVGVLNQFQGDFDIKIHQGVFNEEQMAYIINEGVPLVQRIQKIMPFVEKYKEKKIRFDQFKTIIVSKNKEITTSKEYRSPYKFQKSMQSDSDPNSKKQSDPSSSKNSLERQLIGNTSSSKLKKVTSFQFKAPSPIIKQTESEEFAINAQTLSKRPIAKRNQNLVPPDRDFFGLSLNSDALMNSVPSKQRELNAPNCIKILDQFESLQAYKQAQGTTLKRIQTHQQHLFNKYDRLQSRISQKKNEDDRSDIMSSKDLRNSLFNQFQRDDGVIQRQISEMVIEEPEDQAMIPLIVNAPLFKRYASSKVSFSQYNLVSLMDSKKNAQTIEEAEEQHSDQEKRSPIVQQLQICFLDNKASQDIMREHPTSFLKYLSEDKDQIELIRKKSSLKLLRPEDLDIIKPMPKKAIHRRSQSDNINQAFNQRREADHKKNVVNRISRLNDLKIPAGPGKVPHLRIKEFLQQQKEEQAKVDYDVSTGRLITEEVEEDVNIFKDKFLNSRKRRSSLKKKSLPLPQHQQFRPEMLELDLKKNKGCFSHLQSQQDKRNQLRSKMLLLKNEVLEIGCCVRQQNKQIILTYYFTPNYDLTGFRTHFSSESLSLGIITEQTIPDYLPKYKQKKIKFVIGSPKLPYSIPTIQFSYKVNSNSFMHQYPLPCAFHKYVQLEPIDEREAEQTFKNGKQIVKSGTFNYSKKVLKELDQLTDFFPRGVFLREMGLNEHGELEFAGKGVLQKNEWVMKIVIKSNQTMELKMSYEKNCKSIEFYLQTIYNLLKRQKQGFH